MSIEERDEKIRTDQVRREMQLRRHLIILLSVIAIICVISVIAISCLSAKAADKNESVKYYKSVMVGYGESLEDFASTNYDSEHYASADDYRQEVSNINHLSDEEIHPGQHIIVPYYDIIK